MESIILILTFNEEIHIERCINSCKSVTKSIVVLDSYSNDNTVSIAENMGAKVLYRSFDNHFLQIINNFCHKLYLQFSSTLLSLISPKIILDN